MSYFIACTMCNVTAWVRRHTNLFCVHKYSNRIGHIKTSKNVDFLRSPKINRGIIELNNLLFRLSMLC